MIIFLCLTHTELIGIANIFVTLSIGSWIGFSVQKNLTTNRAVKEYFINENKDIKDKYNKFINDLYTCKISSEQIKEWFKVMTIKINTFEGFIQDEYKVKPDISTVHNNIKYHLTGSDEFNTQYKNAKITFSSTTKNEILSFHSHLSYNLTKMIIDINKANRKKFCKKKYKHHSFNSL